MRCYTVCRASGYILRELCQKSARCCSHLRAVCTSKWSWPSQAETLQLTWKETWWHYELGTVAYAFRSYHRLPADSIKPPCPYIQPDSEPADSQSDGPQKAACQRRSLRPKFIRRLDSRPVVGRLSYTRSYWKNYSLYERWPAQKVPQAGWQPWRPLEVHAFELPKGSFRDALGLRYGWQVPQLPTTCVCGSAMEVEHALSCRFGGLPIRRHNEVRNLLASCLRKVACDTTIEPLLQPLSGEVFHRRTTTTDQDARLNIKASGFWVGGGGGPRKHVFFVRVLNPFAPSYRSLPIPSTYLRHEKAKLDRYEERVREVERAAFKPLVFSATGGACNWPRSSWSDWPRAWQTKAAKPTCTASQWHG